MSYPPLNSAPIKCSKRRCTFKGYESDLKGIPKDLGNGFTSTLKVCPRCGCESYYFMTEKEAAAWTERKAARDKYGITDADMDKLRHMLGADSRYIKKQWGFRNHFCACIGSNDYIAMLRHELAGYVTKGRSENKMTFFHATPKGCKALGFTKKQIERVFEQ